MNFKVALAPGPARRTQLRIVRLVVEQQDSLEEGHAPGHLAPALHLDQRRVLVIAQSHLLGAQLPQPRHKLRFRIDAHPQGQRIDE